MTGTTEAETARQPSTIEEKKENTRRDFLKKSGITGAFATLPVFNLQESEKSISDLKQGRKSIVDLKINHPSATDQIPKVSPASAVPNTYMHEERLFLLKVNPADIRGSHNTVLRSPLNISRFSERTGFQQSKVLYQESDYDGKSVTQLSPAEGYTPFEFDVRMEKRAAIVSRDGQQILRVPAGTESTVTLPERTVTVTKYGDPEEREIKRPGYEGTQTVRPAVGTEEVPITPELTVRNNGVVEMFGASGAVVVPDVPEYLILGILEGNTASDDVKVESIPDSDLFIVHRDYERAPIFDQQGCQE